MTSCNAADVTMDDTTSVAPRVSESSRLTTSTAVSNACSSSSEICWGTTLSGISGGDKGSGNYASAAVAPAGGGWVPSSTSLAYASSRGKATVIGGVSTNGRGPALLDRVVTPGSYPLR